MINPEAGVSMTCGGVGKRMHHRLVPPAEGKKKKSCGRNFPVVLEELQTVAATAESELVSLGSAHAALQRPLHALSMATKPL